MDNVVPYLAALKLENVKYLLEQSILIKFHIIPIGLLLHWYQ